MNDRETESCKSSQFLRAAGAVLLATAGAAQADEVLTAAGGGGAEGFSALLGVAASPMSSEDLAAVSGGGDMWVFEVVQLNTEEEIWSTMSDVAIAIMIVTKVPDVIFER